MIERFKRKFNSLYWHQFALTAGMVLLTLLLLGVSFFTLSYGTTTADKRGEMRTRAELIAQVSADYFAAAGDASIDEGTALRKLADMASRMTDVDFLICSAQGNVLLTTDEDLVGRSITIPQEIVDDILGEKGLYQGRSNVSGTYSVKKFAVAVPVKGDESQLLGIVLAVMDESEIMQVWRSFIGMFLMTSAIILLIAFLASSVTSMRQIQPITDMVKATRAYAAGDFDVRIPELDRSDEIGELAQSFNAMADSLAETERQRRDFIANVSHELKTPMTTIAGYTDGILDGTIPPDMQNHYLQLVSEETGRLARLIQNMLDLSKLESGEYQVNARMFNIWETLTGVALSAEQRINDGMIEIEGLTMDEKVLVYADPDLIHQVAYNLLDNAIKFTPAGGTIRFHVEKLGPEAEISIWNSGQGISPEALPYVFQRFYKEDRSRGLHARGAGLGLNICKVLVNLSGGQIRVESEQGEWCKFVFTLPTVAPNPGGMKRLPDEAGGEPTVEDPASMKPVE